MMHFIAGLNSSFSGSGECFSLKDEQKFHKLIQCKSLMCKNLVSLIDERIEFVCDLETARKRIYFTCPFIYIAERRKERS